MLKVPSVTPPKQRKTNSEKNGSIFDIVVCQADKRIICSAARKRGRRGTAVSQCQTWKKVVPVARCKFSPDLWNAGATCLANHVWNDKMPQCPDKMKMTGDYIREMCQKPHTEKAKVGSRDAHVAAASEVALCQSLGSALAEYY